MSYFHFDDLVQIRFDNLAFSEDERLVVRDAIEDSFQLHLVMCVLVRVLGRYLICTKTVTRCIFKYVLSADTIWKPGQRTEL